MSDDDLEKLAAQMQDMQPSETSRQHGMDAAMAAFDMEFAADAANESVQAQEAVTQADGAVVKTAAADNTSEATSEKISHDSQGFTDAPRLTGQTTRNITMIGRVQSFGRDAMNKTRNIFTLNPKTTMMMGSCAAALFAAFIYVENGSFDHATTAQPKLAEIDQPIIAGDVKPDTPLLAAREKDSLSEAVVDTPVADKPILETPVKSAASKTPSPLRRPIVDSGDVEISSDETAFKILPADGLASNVVVIERRIVKTPATTIERIVPSITKTETRRIIKTPASTVERVIPAVTKEVERQIKYPDGTIETIMETVVVTPASVEYVNTPAEFETVKEIVVVQEASTELVTIPAIYETVRETVAIQADGSQKVLKSETIASPKAKVEVAGDTPLFSRLMTKLNPKSAAVEASEVKASGGIGEAASRTSPDAEVTISAIGSAPSAASAAPPPLAESSVFSDEIVVTGSKRESTGRADKVRAAPAPAFESAPRSSAISSRSISPSDGFVERRAAGDSLKIYSPGSPTPVAGVPHVVERVIPAVTKQVSRRVIKTPAVMQERIIPAITKDVTVLVEAEDGTLSEVTTTFVIQEARTELVTVPPVYETVVETVVVTPSYTEYVTLNPDGTIIKPKRIIKPPKPTPQSGRLTAGDYDDVLNPALYKVYLDKMLQGQLKDKDLPYVDANKRIAIRVVDRFGKAVPLADISVKSANRGESLALRTGADGLAYIYPNFDDLNTGLKLKISAKGARPVSKTLTRKLLRNGGDILVDLNTNSQAVETLDLLLTIDATGSMADEMRYLQSELKAILSRVEASNPGIDIRTGLIVYRDQGDAYVVREIPFTDDIDDFRASLGAQRAAGGGDRPEAMHTAMQAGLNMDWREDALKVNLLVADAPPHDKNITDTWNAGLESRSKGIHIVPLAASGVDKTAEFLMRSMAQITGGRFLFLTDDSGIGNPHAEPTVDCYVVTRLDGLVTRVLNSLVKGYRVEPEAGNVIRSVGNYRSGRCAIDDNSQYVAPQNVTYQDE